jgi:hypothetical protein
MGGGSVNNIFDRTAVPTGRSWAPVSVPIQFNVTASLPSDSSKAWMESAQTAWEGAIFEYFRNLTVDAPAIVVKGVTLLVSETSRRSRRRLQQQQQLSLVSAVGSIEFAIDPAFDQNAFADRVSQELDVVLTEDFLQQALVQAGVPLNGTTEAAGGQDNNPSGSQTNGTRAANVKDRPSNVRIVLGFLLLVLTLASLVFWARVLWKKRQKKLRKRQIERLRKSQSIVATLPSVPEQRVGVVPVQKTLSSDSSTMSSYKGIDSPSEQGIERLKSDDDEVSSVSDPFARELQHAASLDRRAWEEFDRNQGAVDHEALTYTSVYGDSSDVGLSSVASTPGIANLRNVSLYNAPGSQDMGIEVLPRSSPSFPYGDENTSPSKKPVRLTANDAVTWTDTGVLLGGLADNAAKTNIQDDEDEESFEPYGDKKVVAPPPTRSLAESWDLDENPEKDVSKPSRFSFLYPLKRREISDETHTARRSPISDDSPTDAAIHDDVEVTSVSSVEQFSEVNWMHGGRRKKAESRSREVSPYGVSDKKEERTVTLIRSGFRPKADDTHSEAGSETESLLTESMVKEVEEISQYLKQYERKKHEERAQLLRRADEQTAKAETSPSVSRPIPSLPNERSKQEDRGTLLQRAGALILSASLSTPKAHPERNIKEDRGTLLQRASALVSAKSERQAVIEADTKMNTNAELKHHGNEAREPPPFYENREGPAKSDNQHVGKSERSSLLQRAVESLSPRTTKDFVQNDGMTMKNQNTKPDKFRRAEREQASQRATEHPSKSAKNNVSVDSKSTPSASVPYDAMSDSASAQVGHEFSLASLTEEVGKISRSSVPVLKAPSLDSIDNLFANDESTKILRIEPSDDERSQRLGISRYSVERPTAPLISYRDESSFRLDESQDHPLLFDTLSVSPIASCSPSDEEPDSFEPPSRQRPAPEPRQYQAIDPLVAARSELRMATRTAKHNVRSELPSPPPSPPGTEGTLTKESLADAQRRLSRADGRKLSPRERRRNHHRGLLSKLRSSPAILDEVDPVEDNVVSPDPQEIKVRPVAAKPQSDANADQHQSRGISSALERPTLRHTEPVKRQPPVEADADFEDRISPRSRTKNQQFNQLLSMFDSREAVPMVPPSETVR